MRVCLKVTESNKWHIRPERASATSLLHLAVRNPWAYSWILARCKTGQNCAHFHCLDCPPLFALHTSLNISLIRFCSSSQRFASCWESGVGRIWSTSAVISHISQLQLIAHLATLLVQRYNRGHTTAFTAFWALHKRTPKLCDAIEAWVSTSRVSTLNECRFLHPFSSMQYNVTYLSWVWGTDMHAEPDSQEQVDEGTCIRQ